MRKKECCIPMAFGGPMHSEVIPSLQWVEVASSFQIPSFQIIGLPSPEVAEARDRIRSAVEAIGEEFPRKRVVLNLSPASVRKRGTGLDLAMALAILASKSKSQSNERSPEGQVSKIVAWGELGLNGRVKPMGQMTRTLFACWKEKVKVVVISEEECVEASEILSMIRESGECQGDPPVLVGVSDLNQAWNLIRSGEIWKLKNRAMPPKNAPMGIPEEEQDFLPLAPSLERVIAASALGSHHLLLLGPKGTGKSHALEWLVALQPELSSERKLRSALLEELRNSQTLQTEKVQSAEGRLIRRVGPQVKPSALVGSVNAGGIRVGEFSLADGGLLIADELPEWSRDSREALREPLERGRVSLNRVHGSVELPTRFTLAANGNLCPCGGIPSGILNSDFLGTDALGDDPERRGLAPSICRCPEQIKRNYLARLSGPVLDRLDLVFLAHGEPGKPPTQGDRDPGGLLELKEKVHLAREASRLRWGAVSGQLSRQSLEDLLRENPAWRRSLEDLPLSSLRGRHKVLKVALSLGVWDGASGPTEAHFYEAFCYRPERHGLF